MKKTKSTTLHIMRGLPGSGKSTRSNELLKANRGKSKPKILRLNRDSIRKMFDPEIEWSPEFEDIVKEFEVNAAQFLIAFGFNVIIDDTNLDNIEQYKNWRAIEYNIKIADFTQVDIDTCLRRNELRRQTGGNYCPSDIIIKLARKNGLLK